MKNSNQRINFDKLKQKEKANIETKRESLEIIVIVSL